MKGHSFLRACVFGLVAVATRSSLAAQPATQSTRDSTARDPNSVQPERPTVATHAGTVTRGWVELEEGGEWDKAADGKRTFVAPTNLKIGLARRAQLNVLVNLITDPATGTSLAVSDVTLGVKYRIVDDAPIVGDFAILPAIKLPSATTSFAGTGTTDFSLLLVSSHQLGPVAMDLNVGLRRRRWRVYGRRRSDFQSTDRWERWPKFLDTRARRDRLERKEPPRYLLGQRISLGNGSRSIRESSSPSRGTSRMRFTSVLSGIWGASDSVASETLNYKVKCS